MLWNRMTKQNLPVLPVPFRQFFLSDERVLCHYWPSKKQAIPQFAMPESYIPTVLKLVHDVLTAGHPGKEHTLTAASTNYFWPTMHINIDTYVCKCVKCAQRDGALPCTYIRISPT